MVCAQKHADRIHRQTRKRRGRNGTARLASRSAVRLSDPHWLNGESTLRDTADRQRPPAIWFQVLAAQRERINAVRSHASDKYKTKTGSRTGVIRAELFGDGTAAAAGITMTGSAPILALCRKLVAAKHDPDQSLAAYRGD